ncbi:hypothetical protein [Bacillus sp. B15-48]|uniref:hypothetical protein n=1 Tax=Bacillus sp. B15-48 TaxID=1548601 RepID=UPI00193F4153|nr:hypothetical protein [Bacillus sp. B15-48]MBM4763456.1 hypothetical protein [Bacillus sp. B15-48]
MNKIILLPVAIFFTILLSAITVVFAIDDREQNKPILSEQVDLTGDGKKDLITFKGIPLENESLFLKEIIMKVKTSEGKSHKIKLEEGYSPTISFHDLNNDGVNDVLVDVQTGGDDETSHYYLYSFKDARKVNLNVPESLMISSQYKDEYEASIKIIDTNETFTFDLKNRKDIYDQLGLYINGKLNEPMELVVEPFSTLQPIKLEGDRLGLKGVQKFNGVANGVPVGVVESKWLLENGKWQLIETSVRKNND